MVSSTESQGSSAVSDDSEWVQDQSQAQALVGDFGRFLFNDDDHVLEDILHDGEDEDLLAVVGHEIHCQNHQEPSDDRLEEESPPIFGPEVRQLAQHILATARPELRGRASTEDVGEAILHRFVPHLRSRGFEGTHAEEVVGNLNACYRHEVPLVTCEKETPASMLEPSTWKRKNRPTYKTNLAKYKKRPKKKTNQKTKMNTSSDVSIATACVFVVAFYSHTVCSFRAS